MNLTESISMPQRAGAVDYAQPVVACLIAALATGLPVYAYHFSFILAAMISIGCGLVIFRLAPAIIPVALVASILFQNTFVATTAPYIQTTDDFVQIRAFSFIFMCTVWSGCAVLYLANRHRETALFQKYVLVSSAALAVVTVYMLYGLALHGKGAVIYFRNVATPLLMFQIGLVLSWRCRLNWTAGVSLLGLLLLAYGYCEIIFGLEFLSVFNADQYLELGLRDFFQSGFWVEKMVETGFVIRDITDSLKIVPFNLNIPFVVDLWGLIVRPQGPNLHAISYAYALAFFALLAAWRGKFYYLALVLPVLLIVGSKGAIVALAFSLGMLMVICIVGPRRPLLWMSCLLLALYATVAVLVALSVGDFHVLGLIAGIKGFLNNPLGHGLGASGNLSLNSAKIDWGTAQKLGESDVAVESAIGVLLYQLGIGAIAVVGFYIWLSTKLWATYRNTRMPLLAMTAFGILVITTNGLLQEEALFAPLAGGVMLLTAGLALGEAIRVYSKGLSNRSQQSIETGL